MATVVLIVITIIAGAALYGFVNAEAASSENSLGTANAQNVNYLNEKFVVTQLSFFGNPENQISIYIYNNGGATTTFSDIYVYASPQSSLDVEYTPSAVTLVAGSCGSSPSGGPTLTGFSVPVGSTDAITLTLPGTCSFTPGSTYYVNIVGTYGNSVTYFQEA